MEKNFEAYSRYYDLLYKDKNYQSEADYVSTLIKTHQPEAKNILELGCGTGNHAAIICHKGYQITGLERSAEMVELAKKKDVKNFRPVVADIEHFELDEKFNVAISLFHVISYLTGSYSLLSCFQSINKHLNLGGIFIFDVWYSPAVYNQKPETRVKRMSDDVIEVTRIAEPVIHYNRNVVDVNYEIIIQNTIKQSCEVYKEMHPMRHFSIPEIELLAEQTNFELIKSEEFLSGKTPGSDTWGVCFILRKK